MPSLNCTTTDAYWKKDSSTNNLDKSCTKKEFKINMLIVKNKHEVDYFNAGPRKKADMTASGKATWEMHIDYNDISFRNSVF